MTVDNTPRNTVRNKWKWGLFGLGAAAIIGLSSTAIYSTPLYSSVYAQAETTDDTPATGTLRHERIFTFGEEHSALLAQALGISVEELEAAQTTVRNAAIDQAVEDGRITQEQADELKAGEDGELRRGDQRGFMGRGMMLRGWMDGGDERDEALAAALGITVEELQAAKAEIPAMLLAEAVEAGEITQEEADLITARMALHEYTQELEQNAYAETVAQAVKEGVITQEQADQILSESDRGFFGPGGFGRGRFGLGGFGRGGFGPGMDGGHRGWRFGGPEGGPDGSWFGWPGRDQAPDSETPESSSVPLLEIPALDL